MIKFNFKKSENITNAFSQLYEIITLLRSPDGCPWDRAETQSSVLSNLKNEIYETFDEVKNKNSSGIKEESGDVLLNAFMLILIGEQDENISATDVVDGVSKKLISRHPHVFSTLRAENANEALNIWNEMKKKEGRKDEDDFFFNIPKSKDIFDRAEEVQQKVKKVGFDAPSDEEAFQMVEEELEEAKNEALKAREKELAEEVGDLIFASMSLAVHFHLSPSMCLSSALKKFEKRFNDMKKVADKKNIELRGENIRLLDEIWNEIK